MSFATENPLAQYISYPKAMRLLDERLKATPEELALWVFWGPERGGIVAYTNANESNLPLQFHFSLFLGSDYQTLLMGTWFLEEDITNFQPLDRYITGKKLLDRWSKQPYIKPREFIIMMIREEGLLGIHPLMGDIQGKEALAIIENGLFGFSEVNKIEAKYFGSESTLSYTRSHNSSEIGTSEWRKQNAKNAAITKHSKPGGSYEKQRQIKEIWATGKYTTRDLCAEQECAALDMSFSTYPSNPTT